MKINLLFRGLPGDTEASLEVSDVKDVFVVGNLLQQLPKFCPFDGAPTRFAFSQDEDGNQYYGVCSVNDERLKFKFGQRRDGDKNLYPYGWTYYESINGVRYSWHWKSGDWRLYAKKGKDYELDMSKTRSVMFPKLEPLQPYGGAIVDVPGDSEPPPAREREPNKVEESASAVQQTLLQRITAVFGKDKAPQAEIHLVSRWTRSERIHASELSKDECQLLLQSLLSVPLNLKLSFELDNLFHAEFDKPGAERWLVRTWTSKYAKSAREKVDDLTAEECTAMIAAVAEKGAAMKEAYVKSIQTSGK